MTRYGVHHSLKTKKTDAALEKNLLEMGVSRSTVDALLGVSAEETAGKIVRQLKKRIPSRKAYSAKWTDVFTDAEGKERTITYSWQEELRKLMGLFFGKGLSTEALNGLVEQMDKLYPAVEALAEAERSHADSDYWRAASQFHAVVSPYIPGLTDADYYALFKLAGALLVDPAYEPVGDDLADLIGYLMPVMGMVDMKDSLMASHHFETLVARLKTFAPEPKLEAISITVPEPREGDAAPVLPREVEKVNLGSRLEYAIHPVNPGTITEDGVKWRFDGWHDLSDDTPYEEVTAEKDVILYASWTPLIDRMEFTFQIPEIGGRISAPVPEEKSAYYVTGNWEVEDSGYNTITRIEKAEKLTLSFRAAISPAMPQPQFMLEEEDGSSSYSGKIYVNGKQARVDYYDESLNIVSVSFPFKPLPASGSGSGRNTPATALSPGASAEDADGTLCAMTLDQDPDGSQYLPLRLRSLEQGEKSIRLQWKKVSGAKSYVIYGARCGVGSRLEKLRTVKGGSCTVKEAGGALEKGRYYKFTVVALDKDQKVVSTSRMIHVSTAGDRKRGNAAGLRIRIREKGALQEAEQLSLKSGGKRRLYVSKEKESKDTQIQIHAKVRYASSDESVARVTDGGVILAGKAGTCRIYAYAQNGAAGSIVVTFR